MHGWRYGSGVAVHVTTHECSIQVSRRSMHGVAPLAGITEVGSPYTQQHTSVRFRSVDDPWSHTTVKVLGSSGWALQRVSRWFLGLGTLGSLTVVSGFGHPLNLLMVVSDLGFPRSLTVVSGAWHSR